MVARPKLMVPKLRFQGAFYERVMRPFQEERYEDLDEEYMVEGPTGSGKTVAIAFLVYFLMRKFRGCRIAVIRKTKADLAISFMQTWQRQILSWENILDRHMLTNGDMKTIPSYRTRDFYSYPPEEPGGRPTELWCLGMNQWERFKGTEFDVIWMNEGTEFTVQDVELLAGRVREHDEFFFPHRMLIYDVNPEYPQHWANQRAIKVPEGETRPVSTRITTSLKDNPGYYDLRRGEYTRAGEDYRSRINRQIQDPARRLRYLECMWVANTGQILEWDEERNVFDGRVEMLPGQKPRIVMQGTHPVLGDYVELVGFAAAYDWGSAHAGTLQVWGVCAKGRQYLVEEVYHSGRQLLWWAEWAVKLWKKYDLQWIVCDSAAKDSIAYFNKRIREEGGNAAGIAVPCMKRQGNRQQSNMEVLVDLFGNQRDGAPGIFVRRGALAHAPDPELDVQRFEDEIPGYVYAEHDPAHHKGRPEDRPDKKCVDDGLDGCTYFRVQLLGGRKLQQKLGTDMSTLDPRVLIRNFKTGKSLVA